jgi:hypothetical protein
MPGMPCNATELVHFRKRIGVEGFNLIFRDLCINRNNHHKPTFHPLGDFLNPALALLGQGLKKSPIQLDNFIKHSHSFAMTIFHKITHSEKLVILLIIPTRFDDYSYLCKGLI